MSRLPVQALRLCLNRAGRGKCHIPDISSMAKYVLVVVPIIFVLLV